MGGMLGTVTAPVFFFLEANSTTNLAGIEFPKGTPGCSCLTAAPASLDDNN